ncbi:MAG: hypothetical protein IKJ16_03020 [Agathobacter sp.]|nr:hypothetical protein [Agathobacter sp.]
MSYSQSFQIAGIVIGITGDRPFSIIKSFEPFVTDACPEYELIFQEVESIEIPMAEKVYETRGFEVWKDQENQFFRVFHPKKPQKMEAIASYDWKQKRITVAYLPEGRQAFSECGSCFSHIAWERLLFQERKAIFHAACVETAYGGILFSGPSQSGKSTQAKLWCKHRGARLINGDRPILSFKGDALYAYGSPYAGSSKCYLNESCQTKAIVFIKQGDQNQIQLLTPAEAFRRVYSSITVNIWEEEFVDFICEMSEKIVRCIPVFELECRIDKNAVEVLEEAIQQLERGE